MVDFVIKVIFVIDYAVTDNKGVNDSGEPMQANLISDESVPPSTTSETQPSARSIADKEIEHVTGKVIPFVDYKLK